MASKKGRIRSPHPGVVLLDRMLPSGRKAVQARFRDPDTGKLHKPMLDLVALPTAEARTLWAKRKSQALAKRRMDLAGGAPVKSETPLSGAIDTYVDDAKHRLRASTLRTYRHQGIDQFRRWAASRNLVHVEALTQPLLAELRATLVASGKDVVQKGARRGTRESSSSKRAAVTTNTYFKNIKTVLNHMRERGLLPALSKDAIADALRPLPVPRELAEYLAPAQLQKLLEAAQRHDAAVFAETREEHCGLLPRGSTRRYEPIAAFAAFLMLTGCRRGEALGLTWADVDLDALDAQGRAVGEIRLRAANTKTHHARTIYLEVSPALRAMLAAMKLRAGRDADSQHVFGGVQPYTKDAVESARARLLEEYGAPKFDWQMLRSTCATYLTNASGIFGGATVFMSARQLGHSVMVAERHYLGVHRGIPKDAHTLETAMQIECQLRELVNVFSAARGIVRRPHQSSETPSFRQDESRTPLDPALSDGNN
jgi:integrase